MSRASAIASSLLYPISFSVSSLHGRAQPWQRGPSQTSRRDFAMKKIETKDAMSTSTTKTQTATKPFTVSPRTTHHRSIQLQVPHTKTPHESTPAHLTEKQLDLIQAPIHREEEEEEEEEEIAVDFAAAIEAPDGGTYVSLHPTKGIREETENAGIATTTATGRKNAVS